MKDQNFWKGNKIKKYKFKRSDLNSMKNLINQKLSQFGESPRYKKGNGLEKESLHYWT